VTIASAAVIPRLLRVLMIVGSSTLVAATSSPAPREDSAAALFARGDFSAAAAAYAAVLQTHPSDRSAQLGLAAIRLYQNDLAAAEPLLDSLVYADPQNARATQLLAEVMRRRAEASRRTTIDGTESRVPFITADPLPVVRVVANGHPADFLVDTGADVVLESAFAQRIGVKTGGRVNGIFAGGLRAVTERGMLESLALGSATAYDVPVHVMITHASALFPKLKIDGIVGTTYFERFLVTIDYPNGELILRARSAQASAAFQAQAAASHATVVPCYLAGDHFVFAQAQVNGAAPGLFLFDSGLAGGGLMPSAELLKAAAITLNETATATGYGGGGALTAVPFVARRVAVGDAVQENVAGIYTPQGSPLGLFPFEVWGAISDAFLRHYAYTVDFDAMTIVLQAPAASPLSPAQQIFDAAFRRLQSYRVPPYAIWTATWHITETPMGYYTGEATSVEVHRYAVRLSDGMENVSDPIPSGKLPPAIILPEFLGPFAWTLRSSVHVAPPGGVEMLPDVAGLKTIATVVAFAKPSYAIATTAAESPPVEDVDGHEAYHLQLHPRDDPEKHNLRDLWIDVHSYDLWKAHFVGRYAPIPGAPVSPSDVTVRFRNVLGYWVVTRAVWTYQDPPASFEVDVTNNEIGLPATLPDWLFDAAQYRKHQLAGEPDYIGELLDRLRRGGG
jgi:predicted aspartyl protease